VAPAEGEVNDRRRSHARGRPAAPRRGFANTRPHPWFSGPRPPRGIRNGKAGRRLLRLGVLPGLIVVLAACAPGLSGSVPLHLVSRERVGGDSLEEVYELRLADSSGDTVSAVVRQPATHGRIGAKLPAIVLVAGRETGREAAAVIPGPIEVVVLAVEYPAAIPEGLRAGSLFARLPGIRRSAYRMPGLLRGAARFLAAQPEVDSERIVLVGVSFGVPFAAAAATDSIFSGVALHHGGADLGLLFRNNLPIGNRLLRGAAGAFAGWYFRRLEPSRHIQAIAPRPLLLINGLNDTMVPRRSALRLAERAGPPVRQVWLPHDHLMPDDYEVMRELADSTLSHFTFLRREPHD
jgi:hypothetical protein